MKFGGSSVRDAERMVEVAAIICAFPENAVRSYFYMVPSWGRHTHIIDVEDL
jgi:aspartokinase